MRVCGILAGTVWMPALTMTICCKTFVVVGCSGQIHTHYSEQSVLLGGQGIWYDPIEVPLESELPTRAEHGLSDEWLLYVVLVRSGCN